MIDENGNVTVVWDQDNGIWASRYDADTGEWSAPERIDSQSYLAYVPRIALLSTGEVLAVWTQYDGIQNSVWSNHYTIGSGWGAAQVIETSDTEQAGLPRIGAGGDSALVVWDQFDGTRWNVWSNRYVAGIGWGTAELIETDDTGDAGFLSVSVESNGDGIAVWEYDDGTQTDVWANRYVTGVGWGTALPIEATPDDALEPVVTMDGHGNGIVLWTYISGGAGIGIGTNRYTAGVGWGVASTLPDSAALYFPALDTDHHGNAMAVLNFSDEFDVHAAARRYLDGTGWEAAEVLDDDTFEVIQHPIVAMNSGGAAMAAWTQREILSPIIRDLYASRYRPGMGWNAVKLAEWAYNPQVDLNDQGTGVAVWAEWDGGTQLHVMVSLSAN